MMLVKRSDGHALNLDAANSFVDQRDDLIVEYNDEEYFIVTGLNIDDLIDGYRNFLREFKEWPDNV